MGTVYLLHFSEPISPNHPCQHYLGWTIDLKHRLSLHKRGLGSRLCRVAKERGITWELVRTWEGDKSLETRLKRSHNSPKYCPICNGGGTQDEL